MSIALLLLASVASPDFGAPKISGSWIAGCDNHGDCLVSTLPIDEDGDGENLDDGIKIEIARAYSITAPVSVTLRTSIGDNQAETLNGATIQVDGRDVAVKLAWRDGVAKVTAKEATRLILAMRAAQRLDVVKGGTIMASADVEGLLPLLSVIDAEQYRTGTVAALSAPGEKPLDYFAVPPLAPQLAVAVPAASPAPVTALAPAQLAEIVRTDMCRDTIPDPETETPPVEYVRLDKNTTLAMVESYCGGYNPLTRFFLIDNSGAARPAPFGPHPFLDPAEPEAFLPGAWWDQQDRQLRSFGRARSMGDCGQMSKSVWDGEKFTTVEYSSMPECRGSYDYIVTYRREVSAQK